MSKNLKLMFFGDIMGHSGQQVFQKWNHRLKEQYDVDAVIVNGENSAKNGKGISPKDVEFFKDNGVSVITSGNHIWKDKKIYNYLSEHRNLIRPLNYPPACPGNGYSIFELHGFQVAVVSLQGRSFMHDNIDCPFRAMESVLTYLKLKTNMIFVDFHAETTAEKQAMAYFLDGKISGLFGTHTHVQTSDERVLPLGTAFITDIGFCGAVNSIIGMEKEAVINKFITQMPARFIIETKPPFVINGICVKVNPETGKAIDIERIKIIDEEGAF